MQYVEGGVAALLLLLLLLLSSSERLPEQQSSSPTLTALESMCSCRQRVSAVYCSSWEFHSVMRLCIAPLKQNSVGNGTGTSQQYEFRARRQKLKQMRAMPS
jgi:hypothetical protein